MVREFVEAVVIALASKMAAEVPVVLAAASMLTAVPEETTVPAPVLAKVNLTPFNVTVSPKVTEESTVAPKLTVAVAFVGAVPESAVRPVAVSTFSA